MRQVPQMPDGSHLLDFHQWYTQKGLMGYGPLWGGFLSLEITSVEVGLLV